MTPLLKHLQLTVFPNGRGKRKERIFKRKQIQSNRKACTVRQFGQVCTDFIDLILYSVQLFRVAEFLNDYSPLEAMMVGRQCSFGSTPRISQTVAAISDRPMSSSCLSVQS